MKKRIVWFFIASSLVACGQEKKTEAATEIMGKVEKIAIMQNPEINSQNFISKVIEKVKHYPKEPIYYMRLGKVNCHIEVLVNNMPVYEDYEMDIVTTPIDINAGILKSGKQKLTYRLYPLGDLEKEVYENGESYPTLTDFTRLSIRIIQMDNKGEQKLKDEVEVMHHINLTDENDNFIASGESYYEFSFEFQAEVPYEVEGWTNGQDLTKLDQKLLEEKALEYLNIYQKVYENKDADAMAKLKFKPLAELAQTGYLDESSINDDWEGFYLYHLSHENKRFKPIKDFRKVFLEEGKLLYLVQNKIDYPFKARSALEFSYLDSDGDRLRVWPGVYFYLPKGKKLEDGLEAAR